MRIIVALGLVAAGCAAPGAGLPPEVADAATRYPPMMLGGNVHPTDGSQVPRICPPAGSRLEMKGGPVLDYGGADPASPELCLMQVDGAPARAWFGIWDTSWGGAAQGRAGLRRLMSAPSGTVVGFDTDMGSGLHYHDLMRNEGVEDILLLGTAYHALKISHYREGVAPNNYRSVSTVWKDIPSGVLIYGTYQHIAGIPVLDDPIIPTRIVTAP